MAVFIEIPSRQKFTSWQANRALFLLLLFGNENYRLWILIFWVILSFNDTNTGAQISLLHVRLMIRLNIGNPLSYQLMCK